MSRNYKFSDQDRIYFVTFTVVQWVDALTRPEYKDIIVDSMNYCIEHKGLEVYAWCIMSNHVHMIIGSTDQPMESVLRDLKRHTAKEILKAIENNPHESRKNWLLWMFARAGKLNKKNDKYQFWQHHNHPIELSTPPMMDQRLDYIHQNPVTAGYVLEPEHYPYSSAIDYAGVPFKAIGVRERVPVVFIQ